MDILNRQDRIQFINAIKAEENNERKAVSLKQTEIFNDRLFQYVEEELRRHFSQKTVKEMPVVSFINFLRRIIKQEASIYKHAPKREVSSKVELSDEQKDKILKVYQDVRANVKLKSANQKYKLQEQTHIMVVPVNGNLKIRTLYAHQVDAIPNSRNPEEADGYIVSSFDKERYLTYQQEKTATGVLGRSQSGTRGSDSIDSKIADADDYKKTLEYYTYWDKQFNFVFNGKGEIIDPSSREPLEVINEQDIFSPIPGTIPIIDVAMDKDFEYFIRPGLAVTDFTTQYNATVSDVWHISRMQGYSIGVVKGPEGLIPQEMRFGPNMLVHLKTNPEQNINASDIDFSFISPSPDIAASLNLLETMLMNFMSSRGLDPKEMAVDGQKTFNSALERMLAMIEEFEATKDDFDLFEKVEQDLFLIMKEWMTQAPDQLDDKYKINIPEDATMTVQFHQPQMIQTREEKVKYWESRIDNGFATRVDALMDIDGLTKKQAEEKIKEIDGQESDKQPEPILARD